MRNEFEKVTASLFHLYEKLTYRELKMPCFTQEVAGSSHMRQGNPTPEPTLFFLPSLPLSLVDREDTLHDRGGMGSRPGKVYLFIHH